jgi:membrane protein implicated in regulation of membrane protease activity
LRASLGKLAIAGGAFAVFLLIAAPVVTRLLPSWHSIRDSTELVVVAVLGGLFYGALIAVLFGRQLLSRLRGRSRKPAAGRRDTLEGTSAPVAEPDQS